MPGSSDQLPPSPAQARRPRVVIVGGGFAGLEAARALGEADAEVVVVDRTNHHLFQPLLYQVAMAVLAPTDIALPIRFLLRRQPNTSVLLDRIDRIDVERRLVRGESGRELTYDYLVVAAGARHSYFGHDDWEALAPGLKTIEDAREIRHRFLLAFEEAERCDDQEARQAWMTFAVVGGGPTGVELAGIVPDVTRHALRGEFRRIDTSAARIVLVEAGPRVLPSFPPALSERARRDLQALGVEVRTGAPVTLVTSEAVYVGAERLATHTVFWAAGNTASPLGRTLGVPLDRAGRVLVRPDLSIPGHPEVFVVGDLAATTGADGALVPGVAPAAMQAGRAAARNILKALRGEPPKPFRYRDKGNLATIGRHRAVADFGRFQVTGYAAWWLWLFVHILYLAGFRNRLSVLFEWGYAYLTYRRGARLITTAERRQS